jgi:multidrug resistance efflux pump
VSLLDQALWKRFAEATSAQAFAQTWLALQCRLIPGAARGVVVLGDADDGPFTPAAFWPDEGSIGPELSAVAEMALSERRGMVQGDEDGPQGAPGPNECAVAYPFIIDDSLYGVVALAIAPRPSRELRDVMRQLQWGVSWIEVLLRREQAGEAEDRLDRTTTALDLVAVSLGEHRFAAACNAAVTELATRLDCDQVAIGFVRRGRTAVTALSHAAQFGRRMNLIRDVGAAMDEAVDQGSIVLYPPHAEQDYYISRAHGELARAHDAGSILTVPFERRGRYLGAVTFERPSGRAFGQADIELCDCVSAVLGPLLDEKRRNDRLIVWKVLESFATQAKRLLGPRYLGRKLAVVALAALVAFFSVAKGDYRVTSSADIEGLVQRVLIAPFDGYIATEYARAGETVRAGQVLATLDDRDLALERLRWSTTRRQRLTEYNRALAERERADVKIIQAQIEQADAQIALLDEQIARTRLVAPFDGIIVAGDLSQLIGGSVQRGQELLQIAPLDAYRVILEVDETEIASIEVGQAGSLLVSSLPNERLSYTVERITPIAEVEEGRNFFRVEARLHELSPRLRPGMEGIAKTHVDERLLIWVWTYKLVDWARIKLWSWLP